MREVLALLCLLVTTVCIHGQNKRGIAYGHHSPEDLEVLSPALTWWYNWSETPEAAVANVFADYDFDFVPMTWNGSFDSLKLVNFLANHPETKYLLAFNEPNFIDQANMTPSQVAEAWPALEAIADTYGLEIVGPAVNFCGSCVQENGTVYYSPFDYLDDFFLACQNCRVDHIAVHSYMNNVGALDWYLSQFKSYGKPIWVTEFAGWEQNGNINNLSDQINFMIGAVDLLESDTSVYRYAWFIGRGEGINTYPYIDILGANGTLTELGEIYTQMPVHDENAVVEIPARIEAENYNRMNGILLEKTQDDTGFANAGYIESGDWLEYKIRVPEQKTYPIHFRIASIATSSLRVLVDDQEILTQSFANTSGWQNWQTFENSIDLWEGEHAIRLEAMSSGFNINWFQIGDEISEVMHLNTSSNLFSLYPNPVHDQLNIELDRDTELTLVITDVLGNSMTFQPVKRSGSIDVTELQSGIYHVSIFSDRSTAVKRFVKH